MDLSDKAGEAFERFIARIREAEREAGLIQDERNQEVGLKPDDSSSVTEASVQAATAESDEWREREIAEMPTPEGTGSEIDTPATIETVSSSVEPNEKELPSEGPREGQSQSGADEAPVTYESDKHPDPELAQNTAVCPKGKTKSPEEGTEKLFNYDRIAIFRKK